jgi:hypothetical protein
MTGTFSQGRFQLVGRIRYAQFGEWWDEWLMLSEAGQYLWLQEDDWEFTVLRKFTPPNPVDPATAGEYVDFEGDLLEVEERSSCRVSFFEGELTWGAEVGEEMQYLDAWKGEDTVYCIEWTQEEIQYFKGWEISVDDLYKAFEVTEPIPSEAYEEEEEEEEASYGVRRGGGVIVRAIRGPVFRYTLLFGLFCLAVAFIVTYLTGKEVQPGAPARVLPGSIVMGPYKLEHQGRVHKITISTTMNNREMYVDFNFLDEDMEEVAGFDHDFWHESGYDSDGSWTESDLECYRYFVLKEAGTFFLEIVPDTKTPASFKVRIVQDTFSPAIFYMLGGGILVYPCIVFLLWCIAQKGSD